MSFYLLNNENYIEHEFDYIAENESLRLDDTISPKKPKPKKSNILPNTTVIEIMTKKLYHLNPHHLVTDAITLFKKHQIHHLPILENEQLCGLVSDRDIAWLDKLDATKETLIAEFMCDFIVVCHQETSIKALAQVFNHEHINGMPVINDKKEFIGMVTHNDILKWVYTQK